MTREALYLRFKKGRDSPDVLSCERPDGTATWRPLHPGFAVHDLVHYAIETTLDIPDGLYGLITSGWNLDDFGSPWPRGPLPAEAAEVECLVMPFWRELAGGVRDEPTTMRTAGRESAPADMPPPRKLSEPQVIAIRERVAELVKRWSALRPGESLELVFPPG